MGVGTYTVWQAVCATGHDYNQLGDEVYTGATIGKVATVETLPDQKGVIIKPGQVAYINGVPYYKVLTQHADNGRKKKATVGYVRKSEFDALNISTVPIPANFAGLEAEMVPTRLMDQLFRIVEVVENEDYVEVTARHVWYDNLKNYTTWEPTKDTDYTASAVCRNVIMNAISATPSNVATDCTDTKKGDQLDYKNKNLVECFLDPEEGICQKFGLSLLRYNWDFYCLKNVGYNRGFVVENGKNMLGVERTESIEEVATRVIPIGKTAKGGIVWLDYQGKKYVDSAHIGDYTYPMAELLDTGLTIGKDGVTAQNIQDKLLEAAQKRFNEDHIDLPEVQMTIEFLSLGDTEEYAQYRGLDKVYLYDIITVKDTVRGYNYTAQVIEVEHDILTGMLNSVTIGKLDNWDGTRKIATWQVPEVNGENIRLQSILAGSFAPGAIGADDLQNGAIQYIHFAAATIDTLNATTATIADAHIESADISYAQIKALTAENLIAHDAVTDRYYIGKLAVDNAQLVHATVGELIVKASDNHYYRLDVNTQGGITTTDVTTTLSNGEITAGVTSDGKCSIIETDLAVTDLAANNMKGINALIDKITASRIDVNELWARQAFIAKLQTADISSNTSMQLYVSTNAYTKQSGIGITADGVEVSGGKYVKIKAGGNGVAAGKLIIESGNFTIDASGNVTMTGTVTAGAGSKIGNWNIAANRLYSGSSTGYVALDSDTSGTYAMWAGHETAASAPFRVKRDGSVTLTKLLTLGEDDTETEVNLRQANLWKLSYHTVKSYAEGTGGYCTGITLSNGKVLNFRHAGSTIQLTGSWSGRTFTVTETGSGETYSETPTYDTGSGYSLQYDSITVDEFSSAHYAYARVFESSQQGGNILWGFKVDATGVYSDGQTAGYTSGKNDWKPTSVSLGSLIAGHTYTMQVGIGSGSHEDFGVDLTSVYNTGFNSGGATAKVNKSSQTLGYGGSVTVTAQYVNAAGTTVDTSSSCTITAPADNKGTGWTLAVGKVSLPGSGTAASMSVTTPGSTYNTSGATSYTVSADNNYAYIKQGTTTVARASHSAYSNGASSVTVSAAGWVNGSNVVSASNGKSVTVNLPTITLTGGTTFSSHKTTVYASGGGVTGSIASKEVDATSEYNAGWNAYRAQLVSEMGGSRYFKPGTWRGYLWSAPNDHGVQYANCASGLTAKDIPDAK